MLDEYGGRIKRRGGGGSAGGGESVELAEAIDGHNTASDAHQDIRGAIDQTVSLGITYHNENDNAHPDIRALIGGGGGESAGGFPLPVSLFVPRAPLYYYDNSNTIRVFFAELKRKTPFEPYDCLVPEELNGTSYNIALLMSCVNDRDGINSTDWLPDSTIGFCPSAYYGYFDMYGGNYGTEPYKMAELIKIPDFTYLINTYLYDDGGWYVLGDRFSEPAPWPV